MDARLDPAKYDGLAEADANVIRNAGGRISDDAIRSLVTSYKLFRAPLLIEPDVFHAPAVEDAVDHDS
jgi:carbonic anhydrase